MNLYVIPSCHIPTAAYHRPIRPRHVTETERKIPLWTGSLYVRMKPMQSSLGMPYLLAAHVVYALPQFPKGEPRGSY
jgi:hypothetical protein